MSEHDVPAGRDELRERLATTLAALVALRDVVRDSGELNGMEYDALGVQVNRAIAEAEAALLARQEAPAEGISLSAQLSQAAAWMRVWDECQRLGMDTYGAPSTRTGLDIVLDFIRGRAAPQEAREPDIEALAEAVHDAYLATCARLGWDVKPANRVPYAELSEDSKELDRASVRAVLAGLAAARPAPETREPDGWAVRMRDGSWRSTIYEDRETAERNAVKAREFFAALGDEDDEFDSIDVLPVYLGAPAKAVTCPCGGGPGHGDAWCGDYECPTCGRGPKQEEAIFQAGMERGRAAPATEARDAMDFCPTCKHPRWTAACQCAPAPEPSGAEAVVREAKATLSDAEVARIIEAVEAHCGMGRGAWDMVAARDLVEGFAAALGADTRRIDASETLLPCPFCGGEAVRITTRYSENCDTVKANGGQTLFHGVKCIVCGARTSTVVGYRTPGKADAAWNRRTEAATVSSETMLTASCVWTVDEDGNYHTACDGMFIILEGTPRENGMSFCCYCGRTLIEADDAYRLDVAAQTGGGNAAE